VTDDHCGTVGRVYVEPQLVPSSYRCDRPDAVAVLGQLESWFEDYNDAHLHKGLRMQSPREFIRAQIVVACSI
jgi:hypothetical protein